MQKIRKKMMIKIKKMFRITIHGMHVMVATEQ